jgi:hypothetical protein
MLTKPRRLKCLFTWCLQKAARLVHMLPPSKGPRPSSWARICRRKTVRTLQHTSFSDCNWSDLIKTAASRLKMSTMFPTTEAKRSRDSRPKVPGAHASSFRRHKTTGRGNNTWSVGNHGGRPRFGAEQSSFAKKLASANLSEGHILRRCGTLGANQSNYCVEICADKRMPTCIWQLTRPFRIK